jgi:hypothetical protein
MKPKAILLFSVITFAWACQKTDDANPDVLITQGQLDAATLINTSSDQNITGTPFGHRDNDSARFLIRDIFSNAKPNQAFTAGSIIAIKAYENVNGTRGKLKLCDVMIKQQDGYNTKGGNFEYIRIKYDPATDYKTHPFGILPDRSQTALRGKDLIIAPESCVACHKKAGKNRFTFSRN